ncbi:HNH endonuclease signature motif containing protein [Nitrosomonas sp. Nm166]|uniref:HNH endonuclease signature motif containing protein n=1 Tax=Nitrosomonas sp. Nm166 TaxID=1881054 RepID=UPI00116040DF|nr:HNH endonuclease signature motif containing protein [Nitrosomonas sp. Nm166]
MSSNSNADGSIKRSRTVTREFERLYPLPAGYNRADWQIDHVIPLAEGGCDAVRNMQWLPESIKTCADDHCKDRWEREGIYSKIRILALRMLTKLCQNMTNYA